MSALVFLSGCGGDDEPSRSAEETAQAWVDAVNAEDYERVCDLSVIESESDCLGVMKENPFGANLAIENFYPAEGDDEATVEFSSSQSRKPERGWTGYAPKGFQVERDGDEYKVHFEVSIIK